MNTEIGEGRPVYVIAEVSANHNQDYDEAERIIRAAKEAGADAIKLQTYTPDTMTIDCSKPCFTIKGTSWAGKNLYSLYSEAYTPWEWQPKLINLARELGLHAFSTPFDIKSVDFLEDIDVPAYKVASFEIVDIPLLRRIGKTGKPVIMSTGMATIAEIEEAVGVLREEGTSEIALLKCTSAYPARPEDMNLRTIPNLSETYQVAVGVSDHTLGIVVPIAAVMLGACIVEKHLTLSRAKLGPDSAFSLEPQEFQAMVDAVRTAEKAIGHVQYGATEREIESRIFRRSLFVVRDVKRGEVFTAENVRCIRPGYGLHPRYFDEIVGKTAACNIDRGTPLAPEHVVDGELV